MAYNAADRDNRIFDPDRIREPDYPRAMPEAVGEYGHGIISALPIAIRRMDKVKGAVVVNEPAMVLPSWILTESVNCYRRQFRPIRVGADYTPGIARSVTDIYAEEAQTVPISWDIISAQIRKDQSQCPTYFPYTPGQSPAQHAQQQLDTERFDRSEKANASLNRATWGLTCATAFLVAFAAISALATLFAAWVTGLATVLQLVIAVLKK